MNQRCADCARPATLSCVEDGVQSYLCGPCASRKAGIFGVSELIQGFIRTRPSGQPCPNCGTSAADVEKSGLVGCPLCYESLRPTLEGQFGLQRGKWTDA